MSNASSLTLHTRTGERSCCSRQVKTQGSLPERPAWGLAWRPCWRPLPCPRSRLQVHGCESSGVAPLECRSARCSWRTVLLGVPRVSRGPGAGEERRAGSGAVVVGGASASGRGRARPMGTAVLEGRGGGASRALAALAGLWGTVRAARDGPGAYGGQAGGPGGTSGPHPVWGREPGPRTRQCRPGRKRRGGMLLARAHRGWLHWLHSALAVLR